MFCQPSIFEVLTYVTHYLRGFVCICKGHYSASFHDLSWVPIRGAWREVCCQCQWSRSSRPDRIEDVAYGHKMGPLLYGLKPECALKGINVVRPTKEDHLALLTLSCSY